MSAVQSTVHPLGYPKLGRWLSQHRVRAPGRLVLWDNRFTLHYPVNDFVGQSRRCPIWCGVLATSRLPCKHKGEIRLFGY